MLKLFLFQKFNFCVTVENGRRIEDHGPTKRTRERVGKMFE
jgi:hypothetical protein